MKVLLFMATMSLVASPIEKMSLDEKIGTLFMAPLCPLREEKHFEDWTRLIKEYHIGGAIMKASDPESQINCLNRIRKLSNLLIGADAEWGLAMRMKDTMAFPKNGALGALDPSMIERVGKIIGQQAKRVGIHLNFAPVADVNSNPKNPIIGPRSFGSDPDKVAECVAAFIKGHQSAGVWACAKHFPGHGDTHQDSHLTLPRSDVIELKPFQKAIEAKVAAIMTAHLDVPQIDKTYPTSLSRACLDRLRKMGFEGVIVSDALNMKALTLHYSPEEISVLARKAGCDLLLYGDHLSEKVDQIIREDIPKAFQALKKAYLAGDLDIKELDASVGRILKLKEAIPQEPLSLDHLIEDLHSQEAVALLDVTKT
jgi:beta-N-acetylhexosaminidase